MDRRKIVMSAVMLAAFALAPFANAAEFDWNGTWSGSGSNGRSTSIQIAKGKVVSWKSNGDTQKIGSSSVSKTRVSITHAEGAKVTLTPKADGNVQYNWKGSAGASSAVLTKG